MAHARSIQSTESVYRIPEYITAALSHALEQYDEPLWLSFVQPSFYLPIVPWESLLQKHLKVPILRLSKPLRAFIGHIEPTFDWTLKNPDNNQSLTNSLEKALYTELYLPSPVGYAFRNWFARLGSLYTSYDLEQAAFSRGNNTRAPMLKNLLAARDVQSTVLLGDPTVMLPSL